MITENKIYQGLYGDFTITEDDRKEVIIYRSGLALASLSCFLGVLLFLKEGLTSNTELILNILFGLFTLGLGISLHRIHIYLKPLHNTLKIFWLVGTISSIIFTVNSQGHLINFIVQHPLSLLGIGFIFASLNGIFIKEAFCFNRIESKILSIVIPTIFLGYMSGMLPLKIAQILLTTWAVLFLVFIMGKSVQPIPPDIGDKSIFEYLKINSKQL